MTPSLKQYIDLYNANRALIDAGSSGSLNALREPALEALMAAGALPDTSVEGYEKTSLDDMFAPDYGINIARVDMPVDAAASFRCDVPNVSTLMAIVANDRFVPTSTLVGNIPPGVTVMSLARAAAEKPDLVASAYGSVAPLSDPAVALNTLLAQDGVLIHIAKGVELKRPIQIVNIFASATPLAAFRRMLIVAEEGARADLLVCDHSQSTDTPLLASQVVEVICRRGSHIEITDMEESSPSTHRLSQMYVSQSADSTFRSINATLLNGSTRNEYCINVAGDGCDTGLYGMVIGMGTQHIDNHSSIIHTGRHSHSDQSFKYALDDRATGAFEGGIEVAPHAAFTEAYQSNNNVLASVDARMHTKPQLLIYCDDVKCSHGASVGQLNDEALFYMQSRGIPLDQARTMLMQAFMADVIDHVSFDGVRDRLKHLVEKRFDGTLSSCTQCSDCHKP